MKQTFSDLIEHQNIKIVSLLMLLVGVSLDALNKQEYFQGVAFLVGLVILWTLYNVVKVRRDYNREKLPIPIVINVGSNETTEYVLKQIFTKIEKKEKIQNLQNNLKKYSNILPTDLCFKYDGDLFDTERLISFLQVVNYELTRIKESLPNQIVFHIAYYKTPSVGFLVGNLFLEDEIIVYQQNQAKDNLDEIAYINSREYKTKVSSYKKFTRTVIKSKKNDTKVLLAIDAASHSLALNAQSLSKYETIIQLKANHNGEIFLDEDWVLYAREIFTQLDELQKEYKNITIAHSMPESIALIVGKAISNHWNIQVTQYRDAQYKEFIQLNSVKYYF